MPSDQMTHGQRFALALDHKEADRVPIAFGGPECSIHRIAHSRLLQYLGYEEETPASILDSILQIVEPDERLYQRFDVDVRWLTPHEVPMQQDSHRGVYIDEMGRIFKLAGGFYNQIEYPLPLGSTQELAQFAFPDVSDISRIAGLSDKAKQLFDQGYGLVVDGPWGIYEISSSLRGTEALFVDLAENQGYAAALAERVVEEHLKPLYELLLKAVGDKAQMVVVSDDLGSQDGLLFSPRTFRNIYRPQLQNLVDHIRKLTSARIYMHSDGAVADLIPDFIEIGIDGLNPVQYTARDMESGKLKQEFGKYLGFFGGGIDNQILSTGTVQQIRKEVKQQIQLLAPGGGYLFAPIHNISQEVPPENIIAFFEAGRWNY